MAQLELLFHILSFIRSLKDQVISVTLHKKPPGWPATDEQQHFAISNHFCVYRMTSYKNQYFPVVSEEE